MLMEFHKGRSSVLVCSYLFLSLDNTTSLLTPTQMILSFTYLCPCHSKSKFKFSLWCFQSLRSSSLESPQGFRTATAGSCFGSKLKTFSIFSSKISVKLRMFTWWMHFIVSIFGSDCHTKCAAQINIAWLMVVCFAALIYKQWEHRSTAPF